MYGTYRGFSLPLSTLAALVASRPSVWPLASTTYHLRLMSLPLGTKVDILFLPLEQSLGPNPNGAKPVTQNALLPTQNARAFITPTAKQTCSREDCGGCPSRGLRLNWTNRTK